MWRCRLDYRVQPVWVVPVVLLALLAVLIAGDPGRIDRQKTWLRLVLGITIAFLTLANLLAAGRLVADILTNNKLFANHPGALLAAGAMIWATNAIAFGLWYWDLDRGGAAARAHHPDRNPAFVFPEMLHTDYVPATWVPEFVDYLSLGFWTCHRDQSHRHLGDQAMGQADDDARGELLDSPGHTRHRPCHQRPVTPPVQPTATVPRVR